MKEVEWLFAIQLFNVLDVQPVHKQSFNLYYSRTAWKVGSTQKYSRVRDPNVPIVCCFFKKENDEGKVPV